MKRYEHCKVLNRMISAPDGEWVKYEDVQKIKQDKTRALFRNSELVMENARLKELNREMVEAIKRVCKGMCDHEYHKAVGLCEDCVVDSALRKARGE